MQSTINTALIPKTPTQPEPETICRPKSPNKDGETWQNMAESVATSTPPKSNLLNRCGGLPKRRAHLHGMHDWCHHVTKNHLKADYQSFARGPAKVEPVYVCGGADWAVPSFAVFFPAVSISVPNVSVRPVMVWWPAEGAVTAPRPPTKKTLDRWVILPAYFQVCLKDINDYIHKFL